MIVTRMRTFHQKLSKAFFELRGRAFSASNLLVACGSTGPSFLIQDVSDAEQIFRRPEMNIDFFCCPGICVPESGTDKLDWDAFSVQGRGEKMTNCVRSEPRYPGVLGKFFTEAI